MVWICVPLPDSYVEILISKVVVLGSEAFGRWLVYEGRTFMNGISAPMKEAPETSLALFHHVRTQQEVGSLQPRGGPSPDRAGTLILDFHSPEQWEIDLCCL